MTTPNKLRKKDKVSLLAPSGFCDPAKIAPAIRAIKNMGLIPHAMKSCYSQNGYFAGEDSLRASDIMEAFLNPEIKGIFAIRGGYGAQRLLPLLDFAAIARSPKIFAGYSDITALHTAFNQLCGFITYHAPMAAVEFIDPKVDDFTMSSFLSHIMQDKEADNNYTSLSYTPLTSGNAKGILTGGNLSLLATSIGTPYEINTKDKILFIEEVNEEPYKVDRLLLQLKQAGKLDACRAIILGSFYQNTAPETHTLRETHALSEAHTSETLSQAIDEILIPLNKPLGINLLCGHYLPNATLPLGATVLMQSDLMQSGLVQSGPAQAGTFLIPN